MLSGASVGVALQNQWYVVAMSDDVVDTPIGVGVLGERYAVWRTKDGTLVACTDRCPHREAPLSIGSVDGDTIVCAYHGWTFDTDGSCVRIPSANDRTPIPSAACLDIVLARDLYGAIWLRPRVPDVGEPDTEPPTIAQDADTSYRRLVSGMETWHTSATRMTDNFCDVAHFPFVHAGTIGADANPDVGAMSIEPLDDEFTGYRYVADVLDENGERVRQRMSTGFHLPFSVRSDTTYETGPRAGQERVLLLCTTPIDDTTSMFTFIVWRNHDHDTPAEDLLAFDRAIGAEDKVMLEQIPGSLPLDNAATVSVKSDRLSVKWRQMFRELSERGQVRNGRSGTGQVRNGQIRQTPGS